MLEALNIKEIKSSLNSESYVFLNNILKEENPDSILASLSKGLLKKYFEILIKSEQISLYFCEYKNEMVGYAIVSKKPSFLTTEFKSLKYSILIDLILNYKFKICYRHFVNKHTVIVKEVKKKSARE